MTCNSKYGPWTHEDSPEWKRRAREAIAESRRTLDAIPPNERDPGDPNSPINSGLFGVETESFLSMQYRGA